MNKIISFMLILSFSIGLAEKNYAEELYVCPVKEVYKTGAGR